VSVLSQCCEQCRSRWRTNLGGGLQRSRLLRATHKQFFQSGYKEKQPRLFLSLLRWLVGTVGSRRKQITERDLAATFVGVPNGKENLNRIDHTSLADPVRVKKLQDMKKRSQWGPKQRNLCTDTSIPIHFLNLFGILAGQFMFKKQGKTSGGNHFKFCETKRNFPFLRFLLSSTILGTLFFFLSCSTFPLRMKN